MVKKFHPGPFSASRGGYDRDGNWLTSHKKSYHGKKGKKKGIVGESRCRKDGSPPKFLKVCGITYRPHVKGYTKYGVKRQYSPGQIANMKNFAARYKGGNYGGMPGLTQNISWPFNTAPVIIPPPRRVAESKAEIPFVPFNDFTTMGNMPVDPRTIKTSLPLTKMQKEVRKRAFGGGYTSAPIRRLPTRRVKK